MEVLGLSLVTNLAAGISGEPLNHEEVLEAGRAAAQPDGRAPRPGRPAAVRAARVVRHGDPADAVVVEDVEVPEPGPGEVRVAVAAASLNFGDIARCRGGVAAVMAQPPFTLGMDVCGVVDAAGDGAEELGRPAGRRHRAAVARRHGRAGAAPAPRVRRAARARRRRGRRVHAAVPRRPSWRCTSGPGSRPARRVLVRGGASAVGTAAIQLARRRRRPRHRRRRRAARRPRCAPSSAPSTTVDHTHRGRLRRGHGRRPTTAAPTSSSTRSAATRPRRCGPAARCGGRYLAVGFNDDPESGLTGRAAAQGVDGQLLRASACCSPTSTRRATSAASASTRSRPRSGSGSTRAARARRRRLRPAGRRPPHRPRRGRPALEDHAARRTSGRTVVDLATGVAR